MCVCVCICIYVYVYIYKFISMLTLVALDSYTTLKVDVFQKLQIMDSLVLQMFWFVFFQIRCLFFFFLAK